MELAGRVALAGGLDCRQYSNADQNDCTRKDPLRGHAHKMRGVSQSSYHDRESAGVKSE
jgi:hypothetical protein